MTRRKEIIELLKESPLTISEIASFYADATRKDIAEDLQHIYKTLKNDPQLELLQKRPICLKCGFIFTNTKNLTKPGKCPECYSTYIAEAEYKIEKK